MLLMLPAIGANSLHQRAFDVDGVFVESGILSVLATKHFCDSINFQLGLASEDFILAGWRLFKRHPIPYSNGYSSPVDSSPFFRLLLERNRKTGITFNANRFHASRS